MAVVPLTLIEALRGRYTIERELGHGGMATVYLASDLKHDRQVALKVLRPELAAVLGRERFLAEIRLTAKLDHPNVVTLLDSGDAGGLLYYTLPYVRGGSLRQRLEQEGRLPIDEVTSIVSQLASALDHAHAQGVIHRDIKPENVLLHDGRPMLTDFGIALAVREAGGERLTETGLVLGTPQYMSPEQATGDRLLDGRSDLYSLGAVAYEMLAGEPPVLGGSAQAIIARLITERPTPLRVVRDRVPEGIAEAVERAMAKVPADRFATGADFARALNAPPSAHPRMRRHASLAVVGVLVIGAAVMAGAWLAGRRPPSPVVSASMIAVLPPTTSAPDSALARLGRDLAYTLAPDLSGAGAIRAVDPQVVRAEVGDRAAGHSRNDDLALGRRLGAGGVVRGTLVRVGSEVRWDLALLASQDGALLAQATVTAPAESLRAFTDTATRSLLRQIWLRSQPPSPSLDAAVKSRSVPALKAFLSGEGAIVEGRWEDAARAYNEAVAADSTFWLAYWRLWYTGAFGAEVDTSLFEATRIHRAELPDRERLLIEACTCVGESLHVAIRLGKQVTTRFPDDWFAWLFYADYLVHTGPVLGYTAADARAALAGALALKPGLVDAWDHLLTVSLGKDTASTTRALHALDSLGWMRRRSLAAGYNVALQYRLLRRVQGSPDQMPQELLDSVTQAVIPDDSTFGHGLAAFELLRFGFPALQVELDRRILAGGVARRFRPTYQRSLALGWAMRGAWDSSLAVARELADTSSAERDLRNRYTLAVWAVWLGAADPTVASAPGRAAHRAVASLPVDEHAEDERTTLAWLDGLLAVARRDRRGLDAARATVHRSRAAAARYVERSLRAHSYRLDGATSRAGDSLVAADGGVAWDQAVGFGIPIQILSVNRLTEADAFLSAGDTAQAVRLLVWHEAELNGDNLTPQIFAPFAYLRLARIEQAQGQTALAREHYQQFLRRYDHPVARLQPLVDQARHALAEMS